MLKFLAFLLLLSSYSSSSSTNSPYLSTINHQTQEILHSTQSKPVNHQHSTSFSENHQRFTRSTFSSDKTFIKRVLDYQNATSNYTATISCGFGFSALKNSIMFAFKNCSPQKILEDEKFSLLFDRFPTAFLVTFEVKSAQFNFTSAEIQKIEQNLENVHRNFVVLIHESGSDAGTMRSRRSAIESENFDKFEEFYELLDENDEVILEVKDENDNFKGNRINNIVEGFVSRDDDLVGYLYRKSSTESHMLVNSPQKSSISPQKSSSSPQKSSSFSQTSSSVSQNSSDLTHKEENSPQKSSSSQQKSSSSLPTLHLNRLPSRTLKASIPHTTYIFENSRFTSLENSKTFTAKFLSSLIAYTRMMSYHWLSKIRESLENNCAICLRILQLIDFKTYIYMLKVQNDENLSKFHCDIDCFRALLPVPGDFDFVNISEGIYKLLHQNFVKSQRELFEYAVEINENYTASNFLEDRSLKMNLEGLTSLAFEQQQFKVFDFLIRADCPYPQDFIDDEENSKKFPPKNRYVRKFEAYSRKIEKFHKDIKNGDIEEVKKFLTENKKIKFARNKTNKSAMFKAFESEQLEIFALLKSHGMLFSDLNELAKHYETVNSLNQTAQTLMRRFNHKLLTPVASSTDYIESVVQKSKFSYDPSVHNASKIIAEIRNAFVEVNKVAPEILIMCSKVTDLQIIFDFEYSIIDEFEPGYIAVGLTQRDYDYVLIAASLLFSSNINDKNYVLGTVAHELMHYVMYLVYDNEAYPYTVDDVATKILFQNFTEKCKSTGIESHLMYRDNTDPDEFHIELIARIPDLLLMRRNQMYSLRATQNKLADLFEFYEKKVLQDVRDMTETMADREKIREINQWLGLLEDIKKFEVDIDVNGECGGGDDDNGEDCSENDEESGEYFELTTLSTTEYSTLPQNSIFTDDDSSGDSGFDEYTTNRYISGSGSPDLTDDEDYIEFKFIETTTKPNAHENDIGSDYYNEYYEDYNDVDRVRRRRSANSQEVDQKTNPKIKQKNCQKSPKKAFNLTSIASKTAILTNFPLAVHKMIHNQLKKHKKLGIFMKLSSGKLDNFHKILDEISNLEMEVTLVVDCDVIDMLESFSNAIDGTTLKHVIYVSESKHAKNFETIKMKIQNFEVNYDLLCQKSIDYYWTFYFYFQNVMMKLGKILEHDMSMLKLIPMETIYNQDYYSIAEYDEAESDEFVIERSLVDEDGRAWNLRQFVEQNFKVEYEEEVEDEEEDDENEGNMKRMDAKNRKNFVSDRKCSRKIVKKWERTKKIGENSKNEGKISKALKRTQKTFQPTKNAQKSSKTARKIQKRSINFQNLSNSTTFILSDLPGSGKTITLLELTTKIREKAPTFWVSYVNLAKVDYDQFDDDLLQFLTNHVLNLTSFDTDLYPKFFNKRRSVLIFDEFEKLDENSKEIIIKLFKFCEASSTPMWIAINPRSEAFLTKNLENPQIYQLSRFSTKDVKNFLEFFDENREAEILEFSNHIGGIDNPRMLKEVGDVFETYGNVTNLYWIFSQLVLKKNFEGSVMDLMKKLEKRNLRNSPNSPQSLKNLTQNLRYSPQNSSISPQNYTISPQSSQNLSKFNQFPIDLQEVLNSPQKLLEAHQFAALVNLYGPNIHKKIKISTETPDNLEKYGIIYKDSKNATKFIHKSYAAYFTAEYFIENLLKNELVKLDAKRVFMAFVEAKSKNSWKFVKKFVSDFVDIQRNRLDMKKLNNVLNLLNDNN